MSERSRSGGKRRAGLIEARTAAMPAQLSYPPELPITDRRAELVAALRDHQVVVVAGETGSGKSTQLPKLALEAGFGMSGMIGHTQPRRIAARSIAARVADELGVQVGGFVGHTVRFDDRTAKQTSIKVMTDGILLAELQRDRLLRAYDMIVIDEAHERSLNIDFLLGCLRRIVDERNDLHLVITSATIDTEKFAAHFASPGREVPIIEVSGRTFPVELRWLNPDEADDRRDPHLAVADAVAELEQQGPGDILVFSSGEREINDICAHLGRHRSDLEVLPLFARLSNKDQQRVFRPSKRRRVVVSTNVAETSLTVPGIRYVIDLGEARISRFSQRTKVQRLPIEPISQASANQRSGRCGRLGPGIAIRLYTEDDFAQRIEFTEPEIQRTNLAAVLLAMADRELGDPASFPFIDPPSSRALADGARLLYELGAVRSAHPGGDRRWLTRIGRRLARLPVDPRLGRIVLAGDEHRCLHEAIIIAAALAVQDPRERPRDKQQAADEAHAMFADERSDFISLLNLHDAALSARRELTRRRFGAWCRDRFLRTQRMIEWFDIVEQLRTTADEIGLDYSYSADRDRTDDTTPVAEDIHRAVLTGMLSHVGMRVERSHEYLGPRNARFAIQPGSVCFDRRPDWIMSAQLVETSRLWARTVAPIDPTWIEEPGAHLIKAEAGEVWWDPASGRAMTAETIRLHGLPIIADRAVPLDHHDAAGARNVFIDQALVEADWDDADRQPFLSINDTVRFEARNLAARTGRGQFDDEIGRVRAFYDERVPADVSGGSSFLRWHRTASADDPHLLEMALTDLLDESQLDVDETEYPDEVTHGDLALALDYQHSDARITLDLPLAAVPQLEPTTFIGLVPGLRREAVIALVRGLPKTLRKRLVPVPETVDELLVELQDQPEPDGSGAWARALRFALERRTGAPLPADSLDPRTLPDNLRPRYRIVNESDEVVAAGYDLEMLRGQLVGAIADALDEGADGVTHPGADRWDFGSIPAKVAVDTRQGSTDAFPALVDKGDLVAVELHPTAEAQRAAMWRGTRRLLRLNVAAPLRAMNASLSASQITDLDLTPHGDRKGWFEDLTLACLGRVIDTHGFAWNDADFDRLARRARTDLPDLAHDWGPVAAAIIEETAAIRRQIVAGDRLPADCIADARHHLERLTYPGHLAEVGIDRFDDLVRYLRALRHRLSRLAERPGADRSAMHQAQAVENAFDTLAEHLPWSTALESVAWGLEELRVSLFAQHLGTTEKVSPARLRRRIEKLAVA